MPWVYLTRGHEKATLGEHFAAIGDYDTAIRLEPDYADAYYFRGVVKAILNRTYEAKRDIRTALRLAEKSGNVSLKARIQEILRMLE